MSLRYSVIGSIALLVLSLMFFPSSGDIQGNPTKIILTKDNTLSIDSPFDDNSVALVALKARELDSRLPSGDPLYLVVNSPGGSIDAGIELIENLNTLNRPVHTITIFAASMGFQTVQGLGNRYIISSGTLMSHKARGGFSGEFPGQLDSRYAYYLKRIDKLDQLTVKRSGGKLSLQSYRALYANEFWCEGQDCIDKGVADEIVKVSCDKSLDSTSTTSMKVGVMGISFDSVVTKASCPTVSASLDVKVKAGGRLLSLSDPEDVKWLQTAYSKESIDALQKKIEMMTSKTPLTY